MVYVQILSIHFGEGGLKLSMVQEIEFDKFVHQWTAKQKKTLYSRHIQIFIANGLHILSWKIFVKAKMVNFFSFFFCVDFRLELSNGSEFDKWILCLLISQLDLSMGLAISDWADPKKENRRNIDEKCLQQNKQKLTKKWVFYFS